MTVAPFPSALDHETSREPFCDTTETSVGSLGAAAGVPVTAPSLFVVPMAFVAETLTRYAVPFVKPMRSQVVELPSVVHVTGVSLPCAAVTVYPVIDDPPSLGADQLTDKDPLDAATMMSVGAPGVVAGVPSIEVDGELTPALLVAVTVIAYVVPLTKPDTSQLDAVPAAEHVKGVSLP